MIKTMKNSYFDLIRGDKLENNKNVVQIDTEKQYENDNYGVYLCEVLADGEPAELLTPCEKNGHDFKAIMHASKRYCKLYCSKCGEIRTLYID